MAVLALAAIAAANVGSAPVRTDPLGEFRLAPGHAVPIALARPIEGNAPTDFRLGPGHAMPAGLSR